MRKFKYIQPRPDDKVVWDEITEEEILNTDWGKWAIMTFSKQEVVEKWINAYHAQEIKEEG